MASSAYTNHLQVLLADAEELVNAHTQLKTGQVGRQWGLGALNRAVVVTCVSAWEAYVEALVVEAIDAIKPGAAPMGIWSALNASARGQIGRFNNPNPDKVRELIADTIGLQDVASYWYWQNSSVGAAREKLGEALRFRHQIAHGVNPRPTIHNGYSSRLPGFFRRLGQCTDYGVRQYLEGTLGIQNPWPV